LLKLKTETMEKKEQSKPSQSAEEFLNSKGIPSTTIEATRLVDNDMGAYRIVQLMEEFAQQSTPTVTEWIAFDFIKLETRPTEYGKYLICRKDGKIHWETWNGSGWAYNGNVIKYWAKIEPPKELRDKLQNN